MPEKYPERNGMQNSSRRIIGQKLRTTHKKKACERRNKYWAGQKFHLDFSIRCYRKTQMNFWANSIKVKDFIFLILSLSQEEYIFLKNSNILGDHRI